MHDVSQQSYIERCESDQRCMVWVSSAGGITWSGYLGDLTVGDLTVTGRPCHIADSWSGYLGDLIVTLTRSCYRYLVTW